VAAICINLFSREFYLLFQVTAHGQVIGAVIADSQKHAQLAAKKVRVEYENLPALITIQASFEIVNLAYTFIDIF